MPRVLPLLRLANPVVRAVLRSPAHRLLDGSLLLLSYRGRRSGRRFRIPVLYAADGERLLVVAARPEAKQWWRTFRGGAPATLTVAGRELPAEGRVLRGEERRAALRTYLGRFPRSARALDRAARPATPADRESSAAVVAFVPRRGASGPEPV